VLLCLHATIFLGGLHDVVFDHMLADPAPPLYSWFGMIYFEGMIYAMGTAILMVVICKERLESGRLRAAQLDGLTGIPGRAAFFLGADRLLDRCRAEGAPLSVIAFDLDRFKSINDTHGHAMGDRVIRLFVETARGVLRPSDFFGRHGGEEFAVVLPGATVETAFVLADRVRHAFAEAAREVNGMLIYATVSAGVTEALPSADFSAALAVADRALYHAKNCGRNRVERADVERPDEPGVIRVA
jgi:diguanylate cyclase (GGDEF)-like protein